MPLSTGYARVKGSSDARSALYTYVVGIRRQQPGGNRIPDAVCLLRFPIFLAMRQGEKPLSYFMGEGKGGRAQIGEIRANSSHSLVSKGTDEETAEKKGIKMCTLAAAEKFPISGCFTAAKGKKAAVAMLVFRDWICRLESFKFHHKRKAQHPTIFPPDYF